MIMRRLDGREDVEFLIYHRIEKETYPIDYKLRTECYVAHLAIEEYIAYKGKLFPIYLG
jgi:hypothetical protein